MKSSTLSAAFGLLLLASLGGKLLANGPEPQPDQRLFAARAAALLRANGFATTSQARPLGILTHGRKPGCRIMVGDYTPYGTFADVFARHAAPIGPLRFAWRGTVHEEAPKLVPLGTFYLRREALRIGIAAPRSPIAAFAASPGCNTEALDWTRLASLPA